MTTSRVRLTIALLLGLLIAGSAGTGANASSQGLTGVQANWRDLEPWTRYLEPTKQNELGLGLQPSGTLLAFLGRLSAASPRVPPREIRVQIAIGPLLNPNLVRRSTLTLLVDADTDTRTSFDLSSRLVVDDSTPGGNLQNGITTMSADDFARLARARTITGNVFGFDVTFTRDQIAAIKAFAGKLQIPSPGA